MGGFLFYLIVNLAIFLLFFPIVINGELYFDIKKKKYAVSLSVYKKFRFLGGYFQLYDKGFVLHKNEKTAVLIPFKNILSHKDKFSFLESFRLYSLTYMIETGAETFLFFDLIRRIQTLISTLNPQKRRIQGKLWLIDTNSLNLSAKLIFYSNLLVIIIDLMKFLGEKCKELWQKKVKISTI